MKINVAVLDGGVITFQVDSAVLDEAVRCYSLAGTTQLQAILVDLTEGTEDFSYIDSRIMLLVLICHFSGNQIASLVRKIPGKHQAAKIVSDNKNRHNPTLFRKAQ